MEDPYKTVGPSAIDGSLIEAGSPSPPERIGRYRIERLLGQGGFGLVYLARDDRLARSVAIKVPHARLVVRTEDADAYLREARTVANLDHPNIVPVYDVGGTEQFPCFIVSKFIDGASLSTRRRHSRLSLYEAVELVATVAEALHHAHQQGLVHRDVKPGNILCDKTGKPFVVDFGLALREQDVGKGPCFAGTPNYMSPEQARGEGHRVDRRSDIFSLGVVLYELLTGSQPFQADSAAEVMEKITALDVRPPRQWDDSIPKEVERICLKSLSKRASERFATAKDMAEDLRFWSQTENGQRARAVESVPEKDSAASSPGKDVFISYATADKETAFELCRRLEEQGVACWIAPRDVSPGEDYGEAIIRAIEETPATLFLLSAQANASIHVKHEVERATSKRKRVIPVRLEDVEPGPSLELHLATAHWMDAWRLPIEQVALQLARVILKEVRKPATPSGPATPAITPSSDRRLLKVVPKGLRSFDAHDADFFLELLPGPRDRDGLPDSIRFWKIRIEERDADNTFPVGLIYGPSGCGKSSLVKAGLLPRLSNDVIAVYVEATAGETEARLLNGLRKRFPSLPPELELKEVLASLRRGQGIPAGKKLLIILDQFEQWLHAKNNGKTTELVEALRQCDGGQVQCIVMVRDDFWLAVSRFLRDLEIRLVEGQNSALADLFEVDHARKVLTAFGRAFGKIPEKSADTSKEQEQFIEQALAGLSEGGKIICVRLALFAEMMKGKPWNPATLKEVGGTRGVGATFLEETFSASSAPPDHRYHQKAARAVLKALLPDSGSDIKGHMRSYAELSAASGYAGHSKDFDNLIRILDAEIRLITPTDPDGNERADESAAQIDSEERYYQLTHDYLVHSLREWLTRKQRETRKGRAELRLAERSELWKAKPENRHLPSLREFLGIRSLTDRKNWTEPQRKMMAQAGRVHGIRTGVMAAVLAVVCFVGVSVRSAVIEKQNATRADGLVDTLANADLAQVPSLLANLEQYRRWADPLLKAQFAQAEEGTGKRLNLALALLPGDASQVDYLYGRLLTAEPDEVPVIRDALAAHKDELLERLWAVVESPDLTRGQPRLRAAAALAVYDPENSRWTKASGPIVEDLVSVNPIYLGAWSEEFRPIKVRLLGPLEGVFREQQPERAAERSLATNLLADYAADQPLALADLLMDADEKQFAIIFPKIKDHGDAALPLLRSEVTKPMPDGPEASKEALPQRQANAAVALVKLNHADDAWPVLKHTSDPRARTYLIHGLAPLEVDVATVLHRLDQETDVSSRRALIICLGEFDTTHFATAARQSIIPKFLDLYRNDPDSGLHGAVEWLLRQKGWDQATELSKIDVESQIDEKQLQDRKPADLRQWYVDKQGQTFVILTADEPFRMGSPGGEPNREKNEVFHQERIGRTFAIAAKGVTKGQFRNFQNANPDVRKFDTEQYSQSDDSPAVDVDWYDAARYCNWLSENEKIPREQWCYEPNAQGQYADGMKPAADYLQRTGYRLPTEAEWEFACRAGAGTSRYYGASVKLLPKYAWFLDDADQRTWPVGMKIPNDFGLFDMHGNAWQWCDDVYGDYAVASNGGVSQDTGSKVEVRDKVDRVMRGGSFDLLASLMRSAYRYNLVPTYRNIFFGFRVARTMPSK